MRFQTENGHVYELIETVGELREAISHLDATTPIRFLDPDTEWLMRLSPHIDTDVSHGWDDEGRAVFATEEYWMRPLAALQETEE
jgi:hypothetical protein